MKLVILPGNAKANEKWANDSTAAFSDTSQDTYEHRYTHWDSGKKLIDFDAELAKLSETIKNQEGYVIFGKSAGAMLAIYGVYTGELKPERCVFVGLPIHWAKKNNFPLDQWLEKFDTSTIIIQQTDDPLGSFTEVQNFLARLNRTNIRISEIPGNDHEYNEYDLIKAVKFLFEKEKNVELEGETKLHLK